MGCDIHLFVEKRNGSSQWEAAESWVPDENEPSRLTVPHKQRFFDDRNYSLFAILADVRNGYGFAGVDTGDGFVPIAEPRGLPNDVTVEVKGESDSWDVDGHSHSYFTVAELLAYDWTRATKRRGVLELIEYVKWSRYDRREGEQPQNWSGDVVGRSVVVVDDGEAVAARLAPVAGRTDDEIASAIKKLGVGFTHIRCEWSVPYYMTCERFWSRAIPRLLRMGKPEDVRIVFWFDN